MAFQLKRNESVPKGVKRIVRKQMDGALCLLEAEDGRDEAVHDCRKRFKRIRAVLRLVRDALGDKVYRRENQCFRDAGRPLTEVRDAKILIEALDKLTEHFADQVSGRAFHGVREALLANRKAIRKRVLKESRALATVAAAVRAARDRIPDWTMRPKGWQAMGPGLKRVYKRGYRDLAGASSQPTVENLHEWRKEAKYLWHQLQILEPIWSAVLEELADQAHELTQLLGDDHDLAVLRNIVTDDPDHYGGENTLEALLALIDRRREELQQNAFTLGRRFYVDRPKVFVGRMKGYWKAWRSEVTGPLGMLPSSIPG